MSYGYTEARMCLQRSYSRITLSVYVLFPHQEYYQHLSKFKEIQCVFQTCLNITFKNLT